MSLRVTVDLDWDAEMTPGARWHETLQHPGCGHLWLGPDVSLLASSPASWRALAAAAMRVVDRLERLYAEHGAEPPAPAVDETRSTA